MQARALTQYRRAQRALRWVVRSVWPGQFNLVRDRVAGGVGLEVGGPSSVFRRWRAWPIYPFLTSLDLVDFSSSTVWQKDAARLTTALPPKVLRRVLTAEATDLGSLATGSYDVLLASHVIEHLANPLGALQEWGRVVRPGGVLFLVAPHRDGTFDHRRPVTPLAHLIDDFRHGISEADRTHVDEVLRLHDFSRDPGAEDAQSFHDRTQRNAEFRAMHHHVFDTRTLLETVDAAGATILYLDVQAPWHIAVAATWADPVRSTGNFPPLIARNANWLAPDAAWRRTSPFPSDHQAHAVPSARDAEGEGC